MLVQGRFLLYQNEDGQTGIEVRHQVETVWMTQAAVAELYQTTPQNITTNLRAIYKDGELDESATCEEYLQVQPGGAGWISRSRKYHDFQVVKGTVKENLAVHNYSEIPNSSTCADIEMEKAGEDKVNGVASEHSRLTQAKKRSGKTNQTKCLTASGILYTLPTN